MLNYMNFEPQDTTSSATENSEFADSKPRTPLELLRDTEAMLRYPTINAIAPILPSKMNERLEAASIVADDTLNKLAQIDIDRISDWELRPARIYVGLSFVGFGALTVIILLLYFSTLHPELSPVEQVGKYWYQYIWFVNLGVAGMFILGREAMRPVQQKKRKKKRKNPYS
jgi:hypothetical protein